MFDFHPYLGKWSNLTSIFFKGVETTNQFVVMIEYHLNFMYVSKNRGTPKWMVYNGKPYQNGWLGGTTIFGNIHIVAKTPFCLSSSVNDTWTWLFFFCMTSGRGLIHPLEWNTLCPFIARRNGHRLRQMRCKGKLISWSCLSCPYFLFLPLDLTWSRCCAALLAKFSEDSFFHVVTASEKACSMPSGCRCFGKGCDWHRSSFFRNMILSYFRTK